MSAGYIAVDLESGHPIGPPWGVALVSRSAAWICSTDRTGVPVSWLTFPIGTLKTTGAVGLAAGLAFRPLGVAAAIGLILFFVCAIYTHIRANDYGPQFYLANGFLAVAGQDVGDGFAPVPCASVHRSRR
jgi:uncharacterized membrane protein YphA (DoxX/SURF4 family)